MKTNKSTGTAALVQDSRARVRRLTESAILIAFATVLSLFKIADLPYGGSVTLASMFPIMLIAYRHGTLYGLGAGLVHGVIQQLLGLHTLSYVTTWQSILAVILLDYVVAFAVIGLGGVFRGLEKGGKGLSQSAVLVCGSILVGILRYACHVISGATVWAGISIPTKAALLYSFSYNATYMLPETIVLAVAAGSLGALLNFKKEIPERLQSDDKAASASPFAPILSLVSVASIALAVIFDTVNIMPQLQDPESGEFMITLLSTIDYTDVIVVTAVSIVVAVGALVLRRTLKAGTADNKSDNK